MIDAYTIFYSAWPTPDKRKECQSIVDDIIKQHDASKKVIEAILVKLKVKKLIITRQKHKQHLVEKIFNQRQQTLAYMHLYCSVLPIDTYRRSQTSYTAPYNGVVSHGAQIGGGVFWFLLIASGCRDSGCVSFLNTNKDAFEVHGL